jgi:3-phenylpropionate/trans-cinnamate dioxygenase ferredoxin subunit
MSQGEYRRVASVADASEGRMLAVDVAGRDILICHARDGWFALDNMCTHAFARLHEGRLRGSRLICPLHGASFDCRNGAVLGPPAVVPLKTHAVRIVGDHVEVALSG